jgi:peroxiredoxin
MKKLLLLFVLATVLFSCNQSGKYVLHGTVKGLPDGKKITLERQQESLGIPMTVDTTTIKDGKFTFEGKITEPAVYQVAIDSVRGRSFIILEDGEITLEINKDSLQLNKMSGTYNNEQLAEFNASGIKIQKKIQAFQMANREKMELAMKTKDTVTINQLRKGFKQIRDEVSVNAENYIKTHPKSFIAALLLESFIGAPSLDIKDAQAYFDNLDPDLKKTKVGKHIEKKIAELKTVSVGRRAPNFSAPDVNGKKTALNESLGRITIIDFWASWCGPCRAESPNMVALYNEFHAKGLNIIGVSLDKTADKWKEAIAKDGLVWTQVSNLKYWDDPIAAQYGVKSIPATYILNQYGVVVAKDLQGPELRNQILKMLGEKQGPKPITKPIAAK